MKNLQFWLMIVSAIALVCIAIFRSLVERREIEEDKKRKKMGFTVNTEHAYEDFVWEWLRDVVLFIPFLAIIIIGALTSVQWILAQFSVVFSFGATEICSLLLVSYTLIEINHFYSDIRAYPGTFYIGSSDLTKKRYNFYNRKGALKYIFKGLLS